MPELADQMEFLLMDVDGVAAPPRVPQRLRSYAVAHTFRSLRILSKQGWGPAHRYLQDLRPGPGWREYCELEPARAIRLARREMPFSQFVLRLLRPNALCLPRSLSLGTYLAAIGLPAEVIVARE